MDKNSESKYDCIWAFVWGAVSVAAAMYFLQHEPLIADFWALNSWEAFFSARLGLAGVRILLEYFMLAFGFCSVVSAVVFRNRPVSIKAVAYAAFEALSKV